MTELTKTAFRVLATKRGWAEYADIITPDILQTTEVKRLYEHWERVHANTQDDLTAEALIVDIQAMWGPNEELSGHVEQIFQTPVPEARACQKSLYEYASREAAWAAATYITANYRSNRFDPNVALEYLSRAVAGSHRTGADIRDYTETPLPGQSVDRPGLLGLGLSPQLDSRLGGGVAAGELAVLVALPSGGKTSTLCAIGARAATLGANVLHITLEINERRVTRRYDCAFTQLSIPELLKSPRKAEEARGKLAGKVWIVDWSYQDPSSIAIQGLVERMRSEGKAPDIVLVDYMEHMSPNPAQRRHRYEVRHEWGAVCKQLRKTAVYLQLPIITAWQINREGSKAHKVSREHISECWDIVKHADIILGLNRTAEEERTNRMRIDVIKQRDNADKGAEIKLFADMNRCHIEDVEEAFQGIYRAKESSDVGGVQGHT